MDDWGYKITDTLHMDHVDLCEEAQTLSDGSKARNVVIRTPRGGRVRFCMTDEKAMIDFVYEMEKLLKKYGDKMVAVEIDPETV